MICNYFGLVVHLDGRHLQGFHWQIAAHCLIDGFLWEDKCLAVLHSWDVFGLKKRGGVKASRFDVCSTGISFSNSATLVWLEILWASLLGFSPELFVLVSDLAVKTSYLLLVQIVSDLAVKTSYLLLVQILTLSITSEYGGCLDSLLTRLCWSELCSFAWISCDLFISLSNFPICLNCCFWLLSIFSKVSLRLRLFRGCIPNWSEFWTGAMCRLDSP